MSSTNRGAERQETDAYFTPPALARLIVETVAPMVSTDSRDISALEPGCGDGSFLDALAAIGVEDRLGVEIVAPYVATARAKGHEVVEQDFLTWERADGTGHPNLVVGNPPFRLLEQFIERGFAMVDDGGVVAFLARLNFLGGGARFKRLWDQMPPAHVFVLPARPGFTADGGSDSIEYTVIVWVKIKDDVQGPTTISWLDNTGIKNKWDPAKAPAYVPSGQAVLA